MSLGRFIEDYHYDLDESLIAQRPIEPRDSARLLIVRRHPSGGLPRFEEALVRDLPEIVKGGDQQLSPSLWIRNRSRVFPARFYAQRLSGSLHEIVLIEELSDRTWKAIIKKSARLHFPERLFIRSLPELEMTVLDAQRIQFNVERDALHQFLGRCGEMPLPPYIKSRNSAVDTHRYQSVWADPNKSPQSSAAPTASLHFTEDLCERLSKSGVTFVDTYLHVGLGTFEPLRNSELDRNELHSEAFALSAQSFNTLRENVKKATDRLPLLCVGTTALRLLESLPLDGHSLAENFALDAQTNDYFGRTKIFIRPPFKFRFCDALLTNFHLPCSSLLVLLSCFAESWELVKESYAYAQAKSFRFFSYGDASLWL